MTLRPPPRPFPPTGGQNRHSGRQPLPGPPLASYHVPKPVGRPWASSARPGLPLPQASVLRYLKMWILPFRQTCRNGTPSDPERPAPPRVLPGPASRGEEGISKGQAKPSRLPSSSHPKRSPAGNGQILSEAPDGTGPGPLVCLPEQVGTARGCSPEGCTAGVAGDGSRLGGG